MLIARPPGIKPSEITDESVYAQRREFLKAAGSVAVGALAGGVLATPGAAAQTALEVARKSLYSTDEEPNSWEDITTYNNYYEFGTSKTDPAKRAGAFRTRPWQVTVAGEAEVTGTFAYEDIVGPHPLEERIYRLRCVEAWSMVIPWVGFPLGKLLERFRPLASAKYVEFRTLLDPEQMPGQRRSVLDWPYVEGLRMDEAMHPLTILAVGLYGKELPNQNGAPLRLVVPWKYGFKSIKAINEIIFRDTQPPNSWSIAAPREYGFYANVNPEVNHPRWSQKKERRIGAGLFSSRQPTQMFNGYGELVAELYSGMDLRRDF